MSIVLSVINILENFFIVKVGLKQEWAKTFVIFTAKEKKRGCVKGEKKQIKCRREEEKAL